MTRQTKMIEELVCHVPRVWGGVQHEGESGKSYQIFMHRMAILQDGRETEGTPILSA